MVSAEMSVVLKQKWKLPTTTLVVSVVVVDILLCRQLNLSELLLHSPA